MFNQILYTACVTPFNSSGDAIDYPSFEKMLRSQVAEGNGIVLLGSTGEALSLTDLEKRQILTFVAELKLETQILVGVPSYNLKTALEWIDFCNQMPIDGYLIATPIYTKPGIIGQTKWYQRLLDAASHPVMVYNIPSRTGVKLYLETIIALAKHPRLAAIKDSSGTIDTLVAFKKAAPEIAVYCGDDDMMPAMAAEGAAGLISVASNAWPKAVRQYVKSCLNREITDDAIRTWSKALKALFSVSNPIPMKALLKEIGMIENDVVRLPLAREELSSIDPLLMSHRLINQLGGDHEP